MCTLVERAGDGPGGLGDGILLIKAVLIPEKVCVGEGRVDGGTRGVLDGPGGEGGGGRWGGGAARGGGGLKTGYTSNRGEGEGLVMFLDTDITYFVCVLA